MRRKLFLLLLIGFLLLAGSAAAELSTNLQLRTETDPRSKRVTSQTYVDASGNTVIADDKGYATERFSYTDDWKVAATEYLDPDGNPVNCLDGYAQVRYAYRSGLKMRTEYLDADGKPVLGPEGYARQESYIENGKYQNTWEYDTEGNPVNLHHIWEYNDPDRPGLLTGEGWYDTEGNPAIGPDGFARAEYRYRKTLLLFTGYYGTEGEPVENIQKGYAILEYTLEHNRYSELNYYDASGNLVPGPDGYARCVFTYIGDDPNVRRQMFYNVDGSLFFTEKGYCGIQRSYKTNGKITDESYFTGEDERGFSSDGYSRVTRQYTKLGQIGLQCYYDEQDRLMIPELIGYAMVRNRYDGTRLIRTEYYGTEEEPIIGPEGYFAAQYTYDGVKQIRAEFFDLDGKTPICNIEGYARADYDRDGSNRILSERYFDTEGNRMVLPETNADETRYEWEGKNKTLVSYWTAGEPAVHDKLYHAVRYEYTGDNRTSSETYLGPDGNRVLMADGYARLENQYNSQGKVMARLYYGTDGQLVHAPGKEYAYVRTISLKDKDFLGEDAEAPEQTDELDIGEDGEEEEAEEAVTEEEEEKISREDTLYIEYYGTDNQLMLQTAGYAIIVRQVDERGRTTAEAYFDARRQKTVLADGYHSIRQQFGEGKLPLIIAYYGLDGEPVLTAKGYAAVRREYDKENRVVLEEYFDKTGERMMLQDGYHILTREYASNSGIASEAYFGLNREPVINTRTKYHRIERTWSDDNLTVHESWLDAEGNPTTTGDTYTGVERDLDERGNTIAQRTYGPDGNLIARNAGYDEFRQEFSEQKWPTRIEYYLGGKPYVLGNGYAALEREYDETGNITCERYFGPDGNPTARKGGYDEIRQEYNRENRPERIRYYLGGEPYINSEGYAALEREYDESGRATVERYYDAVGNKTLVADGYHFFTRVYGEDGFIASLAYFGLDGEPVTNTKTQYHRIDRTWLDANHAVTEAWFGIDGEPVTTGDTYVRVEREFDARGNTVMLRTYGRDGNPIARMDGYDELRQAFNAQNKPERIEYYLGGAPFTISAGYAALEREYDDQGRIVLERYFDANGERTLVPDGYHSYTQVYGADGFVASVAYFGVNGEAVINTKTKYHRIDRTYKDKNHITSEAWFDENDQPMTMGDEFVRIEREFDEKGNTIVVRTYGADGELISQKDGYDELRQEFNEQGKEFNEQGKPVRTAYYMGGEPFTMAGGYAALERKYDDAGNVIWEKYFDAVGNPTVNTNGYGEIRKEYDENKKAVYEAWFDADGRPVPRNSDVYCAIRREFDEAGNAILEKYMDAEGNPTVNKNGYGEIRREYNENKQAVYEAWFDADGRPMTVSGDDYFAVRREYDENGRAAVLRYLDADGRPMPCKGGYEVLQREFDEAGNVIREKYFDREDNPTVNGNGYGEIRREFNEKKQAVYEAWFDADGFPMPKEGDVYFAVLREYDGNGKITVQRFLDCYRHPTTCRAGYAVLERKYDDAGHVILERYYNANEEKMLMPDGYNGFTQVYGEDGLVASLAYFGVDGEPVINTKTKYCRIDRTWLDSNHASSEAWFDTEGNPMTLGDTYVRIEREFDEAGNVIRQKYYGEDGNPVANSNGYGEIRREFDEKKQVVYEAWFDTEGQPMCVKGDVYYAVRKEYDENGLANVLKFLDAEGQPMSCKAGYEMVWRRFNEEKKVVYESYMENDGTPMTNTKGVYQTTYDYDENGKVIREQYFDENGQPMACKDGYLVIEREYGSDGKTVHETKTFPEGEPTEVPSETENGEEPAA